MFELPERISIDIPQPCDQNWDSMSQSEKGRFCEKCSKHLIDFRDKTDKEIAELHLTSWGKVCGIYLPEQLTPRTEPLKRQ